MVRSMIAGVAGLKSHQSKLDVIGNNIANVNTWGFKSYSYNFQDAMYTNTINSTGGSQMAGAAGGNNASQVGYGSQLSSISTEFNTGAPAPSSNNMDCMIDGTGFFLVGNMVNGAFDDVEGSGLYLSRVGIFRVDGKGYLVDNQGSYVYGYSAVEGTGTPETPASASAVTLKDIPVELTPPDANAPAGTRWKITIAGITVETSVTTMNDFEDAVNDWVTAISTADRYVTQKNPDYVDEATTPDVPKTILVDNPLLTVQRKNADGTPMTDANGNPVTDFLDFTKVNISLDRIGRYLNSATLSITAKESGDLYDTVIDKKVTDANGNLVLGPDGTSQRATDSLVGALLGAGFAGDELEGNYIEASLDEETRNQGNLLIPGVPAEYATQLSTIRIPIDPNTGLRYDIQGWRIDKDGTIMGTDKSDRTIPIGQLALISVENPNGLEKQSGYYYSIGPNAGDVEALRPNSGPVGVILGGNLEMANVDLANEFSNMITTQRGFQANSKIISVTDEMLQELVNMKR